VEKGDRLPDLFGNTFEKGKFLPGMDIAAFDPDPVKQGQANCAEEISIRTAAGCPFAGRGKSKPDFGRVPDFMKTGICFGFDLGRADEAALTAEGDALTALFNALKDFRKRRLEPWSGLGFADAYIDPCLGAVGNHINRSAAIHPADIDNDAGLEVVQFIAGKNDLGKRDERIAALLKVPSRVSGTTGCENPEKAAPQATGDEFASGEGTLENQPCVMATAGVAKEVLAEGRTNFLVRGDDELPTKVPGPVLGEESFEGLDHDEETALHVGNTRAAGTRFLKVFQFLERMSGTVNGIEVPAEKYLKGSLRAETQAEGIPGLDGGTVEVTLSGKGDPFNRSRQVGETDLEGACHTLQAGGVGAPGVDVYPLLEHVEVHQANSIGGVRTGNPIFFEKILFLFGKID